MDKANEIVLLSIFVHCPFFLSISSIAKRSCSSCRLRSCIPCSPLRLRVSASLRLSHPSYLWVIECGRGRGHETNEGGIPCSPLPLMPSQCSHWLSERNLVCIMRFNKIKEDIVLSYTYNTLYFFTIFKQNKSRN